MKREMDRARFKVWHRVVRLLRKGRRSSGGVIVSGSYMEAIRAVIDVIDCECGYGCGEMVQKASPRVFAGYEWVSWVRRERFFDLVNAR